MSILSFNITSSNESFQTIPNDVPYQIFPQRLGCVNYKRFRINHHRTNILIHTGYNFNPWHNPNDSESRDKHYVILMSYVNLYKHLKAHSLLIHGPSSLTNMKYFDEGLKWLQSICNGVRVCIEIPSFTKDHYKYVLKDSNITMFQYIMNYIDIIIDNGFDIVIDTAHLHSHGLTTLQMCDLLNRYKDHYSFIHLNGNAKQSFQRDKHTTLLIDPECPRDQNMMQNVDILLECCASLNKWCISEEKHNNYNYYKRIADAYGFKLVDERLCSMAC